MDDLISRQQTIDAMAELQGSTSSKGVLKGISKAWKRIEQLPPIQPVNNSEIPNSSDAISRQAAIDALVAKTIYTEEELKEYYEEHSHVSRWESGIYDAVETIKQLPPAEHGTNLAEVGTDVISRQAAIDAIQAHKHNVLDAREYDEGVACGYAAAHNHICDVIAILPSAQPEIVRCKDCKYWHSGSCEYTEHTVNSQDYMIGDIETEAEHFCGYAERRGATT